MTFQPTGGDAGPSLAVAIGSGSGCTSRAGGGTHRCVTNCARNLAFARYRTARAARSLFADRLARLTLCASRLRLRTEAFRHASVQYR